MSIFYFGIFRHYRDIRVVNRLWDKKREALREVLKGLRVEVGLTQAQLAEKLSKPQSYVSKYESGERKLDFIEVLEVLELLGFEVDSFLGFYQERLSMSQGY